jgi:formylglycine-generating enzyme required for sulfatase activity
VLDMVYVPAGEFVMGDAQGLSDEQPACVVRIDTPFWMSQHEITNEQYALFDPSHDSRHEHGTASFNSERALGPKLNQPAQPVVRVSWEEAMAFGDWVTQELHKNNSSVFPSGRVRASLPTEAQWEYACRAGTSTASHFGGFDDDFSRFANVSDATMNGWATYNEKRRSADIVPRDARFNDRALVSAKVGSYEPNPWHLYDMHGNVWEWTCSNYASYPYNEQDRRNACDETGQKVVRGGSWYDRPKRCSAAFRLSYPAWRKVYNVGFRIVIESNDSTSRSEKSK